MKFSCTESNFFIMRLLAVEQVTLLMMASDYPAHSAVLSLGIRKIFSVTCIEDVAKTNDSMLQGCFHEL
jgi:hypothetical protein